MHHTLAALPFIGIRLVEAVLTFFLANAGSGHSWESKVGLGFLPEIVATAMFVIGGYRTRNMYVSKRRGILSKA